MILPSTVDVPFIADVTYFLNFNIGPNSKVRPQTIVPSLDMIRMPEHIIAYKYDYIIKSVFWHDCHIADASW
jgi:NDP-sugar pyrophosphorylase family protein